MSVKAGTPEAVLDKGVPMSVRGEAAHFESKDESSLCHQEICGAVTISLKYLPRGFI